MAALAGFSHILLDFTNNYGVRPFWPFFEKWYSWDIVFIFEPIMFGFLLLGLIVPSFFSLIDQGDRCAGSHGPRGRGSQPLWHSWVWSCSGACAISSIAAQSVPSQPAPTRVRTRYGVSAYPSLADPFHWYGVVETPAFFALAPVNSLGPEVDPEDRPSTSATSLKKLRSLAAEKILPRLRIPRLGAVPDHRYRGS